MTRLLTRPRMEYRHTRSGHGPQWVEDTPGFVLPVAFYAPKPEWMTHIPGGWLRFGDRSAFEAFLGRAG